MKFFIAFLILSVAACAPVAPPPQPSSTTPGGSITFRVEAVGIGTVRLLLDNGSSQAIGYNLCSSELQRRSGSEWVRVPVDEVCTMELRTLNPGHDATFEKRLPPALAGGEYRYATGVEVGGARRMLTTNAFTVGGYPGP